MPMVETTTTTNTVTPRESRLGMRQRHVAPATSTLARTSGAPFWALAFFLVLGIGIALVLGLRGYDGPGLLTQQEALTATGVALFTIAVVLLIFLGTIAYVFSAVRRLRTITQEGETRRIADVNRQEAVNRQLRDEVASLRQREHLLVSELSRRRRFAAGASEEDPHVIALEGVGPRYATRLNGLGIITVNQLVAADAEDLARRIEATPELVREWQAMGRLIGVKGVGPQWAEALARVGVTGPDDLAQRSPQALSAQIAELNRGKVRVTGTDPSPAQVGRWVRSAGGNPVTRTRRASARPAGARRTRPPTRARSRPARMSSKASRRR
jgi:predicted flap endonuclease-1-like 5' DNA nuclease